MESQTIEQAIVAHEARNLALLRIFQGKGVDLSEPRKIESHFWAWSQDDAAALASDLLGKGFRILGQRPAALKDDPGRWNVEAEILQSIDLTMRREFIDELVRLAVSRRSVFDGWGTSI